MDAELTPLQRLLAGLKILEAYAVDGKLHELQYAGVGIETVAIDVDHPHYRLLQANGFGWSTDVEEDGRQLWIFTW